MKTDREKRRKKEDRLYTSVIIKRNDDATRHPDDTLEIAMHEGLEQVDRTNFSLFLSSLAAGLILGFAAMLVALASQMPIEHVMLKRLVVATAYPLGFIICILSGNQLFTEHTATAFYPFLDKKISFIHLLDVWAVIIAGNITGALGSALLLYNAEFVIQAHTGIVEIYQHLIHFSFLEVFYSAILAGWLMAQGGWLVLSTTPTSIKVICIFIVTFIIGIGGFHHSIAGAAEIFLGFLHTENPDYMKGIYFIIAALLGNLAGGSTFVAILNYSHIRKAQL